MVSGVNCGQDDVWTGGYDWYPCQHERYLRYEGACDEGEQVSADLRTAGSTTRPTVAARSPSAQLTRS